MKMKNPAHPGRVLKNQLEELEIPVADAAKALGVTRQQLYRVINGESGISPEMAVRLSKGIGSTAEGWLAMQQAYDLSQIEADAIKVSKITLPEAPRPKQPSL
jgi:antitoxin HigA-1